MSEWLERETCGGGAESKLEQWKPNSIHNSPSTGRIVVHFAVIISIVNWYRETSCKYGWI